MPDFDIFKAEGEKAEVDSVVTICHRDKQPCQGPACSMWLADEDDENTGVCAEVSATERQGDFYELLCFAFNKAQEGIQSPVGQAMLGMVLAQAQNMAMNGPIGGVAEEV